SAAASCSDCHGNHAIFPAKDQRSAINHWKVPGTCGHCHTEIAKTYLESIHGQAMRDGAEGAPVCTDCHGEHTILAPRESQSLVNPGRVSTVTCGRCHGDERLDARYNLPADRVPTFADSFHGLESRAGGQTVANCASCHGVHDIYPSSDLRSSINPANLARTCGKCHRGAGTKFAIGKVHLRQQTPSEPVALVGDPLRLPRLCTPRGGYRLACIACLPPGSSPSCAARPRLSPVHDSGSRRRPLTFQDVPVQPGPRGGAPHLRQIQLCRE